MRHSAFRRAGESVDARAGRISYPAAADDEVSRAVGPGPLRRSTPIPSSETCDVPRWTTLARMCAVRENKMLAVGDQFGRRLIPYTRTTPYATGWMAASTFCALTKTWRLRAPWAA